MPTISGIVVATGTEATGRRTLSDVVDELARPVNADDSTIRALAADAFRAAVRRVNYKGNWSWEILDETVAITQNSRFSTVQSAVKKPLSMHLVASDGVTDQRLCYIRYQVFMEMFSHDISGQPTNYTIPNLFETGQVRWHPIPTANDTAQFTYFRVTPAPRVETEVIEIPDYATEMYMAFAWYEFVKRCPQAKNIISLQAAREDAKQAFREMSAHIMSPGDTSREV